MNKVNTSMETGISIIIPSFNREVFIGEAIQSILDQDFDGGLEIIVADDGSTDGTLAVAERFGSPVKILRKPKECRTQGVASTRNRGLKQSIYPLICFLDSDDFYLPGHLRKMADAFEGDPKTGFAFCRVLEAKVENGVKKFKPWTRTTVLKNDIKNPVVSRSRIVHTNSFMFRRTVFEKVGMFDESFTNGEDGDLWMKISEQFTGKFLDYFGAAYRSNHQMGQLTKNHSHLIVRDALQIFRNAKSRYYQNQRKDQRRIFKIKSNLLWLQYRAAKQARMLYYIHYLILIVKYPLGYLQKLIEKHQVRLEDKNPMKWQTLDFYIN